MLRNIILGMLDDNCFGAILKGNNQIAAVDEICCASRKLYE